MSPNFGHSVGLFEAGMDRSEKSMGRRFSPNDGNLNSELLGGKLLLAVEERRVPLRELGTGPQCELFGWVIAAMIADLSR